MSASADILRLRVLLCFLKSDAADCTVTGIARTLNEKKYSISRALAALENEDYINRDDVRNPILTEKGYKAAVRYSERLDISLNHLLYEGVDIESAKRDAFYWSLYCTDRTMDVVRATENRYRVKYELREQKQFSGAVLCKKLNNGCYQLPFLICSEYVHNNGNNLSIVNEGFEHPCSLCVENGVGTIKLRSRLMSVLSQQSGEKVQEHVKSMKYSYFDRFVSAESNGSVFSFPAECLNFVNIGSGVGQILDGSVCLHMDYSGGSTYLPETKAIFTILI